MDVLKRLALVFHALSFLIGVIAFATLMVFGVIDNSKNDIWYFLSAPVALFVINGLGWTIRYIFEGKANFIPFSFKSIPQVPYKYSLTLIIVLIIIAGSAYLIDRNTILQNAKNDEIKLAIHQEERTLAVQESSIRLNQSRIERVKADELSEKLAKVRLERAIQSREKEAEARKKETEANKVKDWMSLRCNVTNQLKNATNAPSSFSFILKKRDTSEFPEAIQWLDYSNGVGVIRSKNLVTYCPKNGFGGYDNSCSSNVIERVGDVLKFRLEFTDWRYIGFGSVDQIVSLDFE